VFSDYNDILTVNDVTEILMCGRNKVYELLASNTLKGFRIGKSNWRITKKSLETYIIQKCRTNY